MIASGTFRPGGARRSCPSARTSGYRSWKTITEPVANAVIIYMMDVSGSMGDEQKEIVRIESFWIDTWLSRQYKGLESRYIIHDAIAREVDRDTFFHTRESGGTMISSRLQAVRADHRQRVPARRVEHLSVPLLRRRQLVGRRHALLRARAQDQLLPRVNMFGYGQVECPYGSGQFIKDLQEHFSPRTIAWS